MYGLSFGAITFQNAIFANISKAMRDREFISIIDIQETIHGLSFGAMNFVLGPRSRGQNAIFANISKTTTDRDFIFIIDI